jgi:hypothetical protein
LAALVLLTATNTTVGELLLFDDFDQPPARAGNLSISDDHARTIFTPISFENPLADISVQTQLRITEGAAGVVVRSDARQPAPNGYYGLIRPDGTAQLGWAGGDWPVLREAATGLDPTLADVVLQLAAIDNQITFSVWATDRTPPSTPTLALIDDAVAAGSVALGGVSIEYPNRGLIDAVFRYVRVTHTQVPEPVSIVLAVLACGTAMLGRSRNALRHRKRRPDDFRALRQTYSRYSRRLQTDDRSNNCAPAVRSLR